MRPDINPAGCNTKALALSKGTVIGGGGGAGVVLTPGWTYPPPRLGWCITLHDHLQARCIKTQHGFNTDANLRNNLNQSNAVWLVT